METVFAGRVKRARRCSDKVDRALLVAFGSSRALFVCMRTNEDRQRDASTTDDESERLMLTIPQAAHRLGVGRTTVYELTNAEELELVHIRGCARIPAASVDDFVQRIRDQR
jgi:excisionase family DNA binding protein